MAIAESLIQPDSVNETLGMEDMSLMLMSVNDERFIRRQSVLEDSEDHQLMNSTQSLKKYTKEEMLKFLNRVLDRNKPLFLFNSKVEDNREGDTGTPSFSMIALIEK